MADALIGWTGFVGGNLVAQHRFDACFRSTDIEQIRGRRFDLVVCAGAPGTKWQANLEPDRDRASIASLANCLAQADVGHCVLISTVDVFADPMDVDEASPVADGASPYGVHRRELEVRLAATFPTTILRLPALFGPGLKKNAIYDLLHDHEVGRLDPRASQQLYDTTLAWADIEKARALELELLHVTSEPLTLGTVAERVFGRRLSVTSDREPARYRMRSRHAAEWSGTDGYLYGAERMIARLQALLGERR